VEHCNASFGPSPTFTIYLAITPIMILKNQQLQIDVMSFQIAVI
jgi:hypothetical protein